MRALRRYILCGARFHQGGYIEPVSLAAGVCWLVDVLSFFATSVPIGSQTCRPVFELEYIPPLHANDQKGRELEFRWGVKNLQFAKESEKTDKLMKYSMYSRYSSTQNTHPGGRGVVFMDTWMFRVGFSPTK